MNLTTRQWGIVGLAVATALIHLALAFGGGGFFMVAFLLNAVGYLALVAALYFLPQFAKQRELVRWALLGFTAVTFILYFVFNWPDVWSPMGLLDKGIELALMVLLWLDR
ncbi:MAG: hypothetical protein IAE79_04165 [Anaerolinea sp.]|nr:hypothetical protein [Anaerolinea sp.]